MIWHDVVHFLSSDAFGYFSVGMVVGYGICYCIFIAGLRK